MRLLTYQEAAEYLGLKVSTLYSMVHKGRVPHRRLGRRLVRFSKLELDVWLDSCAAGPTTVGLASEFDRKP